MFRHRAEKLIALLCATVLRLHAEFSHSFPVGNRQMIRQSLRYAAALPLLATLTTGPEITPEIEEKIKQEDAAVDAAEGGQGAVRNN
jgi:hypothetical protein